MRKLSLGALLVSTLLLAPTNNAHILQTVPVVHAPITEDQFYHIIGDRMGSQGYVTVTYKLVPPTINPNPFGHPNTQPTNMWLPKWVEVGQTTLFGSFPMGAGVNFDEALTDLKHKHPYLLPQEN